MSQGSAPRIKKPILVPLAVVLVFVLSVSLFGFYRLQRQHLEEGVRRRVGGVERLFRSTLESEAAHIGSLLDFCARDKSLLSSYLAKDRARLLHDALPFFSRFRKQFNITHLYFYDPDRVCFLRVHNPGQYGDRIGRFTLRQACRHTRSVHGIELGPLGTFTLRVVRPWMVNGKPAGYIECGKEITHIVPRLKDILGLDLYFLINKRYLDRAMWEHGRRLMGRSGGWGELPDHVVAARTMEGIPHGLGKYLNQSHGKRKGLIFKLSMGKRKVWGGFSPLRDAAGTEVGEIVVLQDNTRHLLEQKFVVFLALIGIFSTGLLFSFFFLLVGRLEKGVRKAQQNLEKEAEEKYHTLVNGISDGVFVLDDKGCFSFANRAIAHIHGLAGPGELIGKSPGDFVHRDERQGVLEHLRLAYKTGTVPESLEVSIDKPDGSLGFIQVHPTAIVEEGKMVGIWGTVRDVTLQKQARQALEESRKDLERRMLERTEELRQTHRQLLHAEKLSAMGTLSASVAHEFNNPLCGIRNVLEGLRRRVRLDEENEAMVRLAIEECRRIIRLSQDLQNFNRPTSGVKELVDIHQALEEILLFCKKELSLKRIEVVREYAANLPEVRAIGDQLRQVFLNLLKNAAQAISGPGGRIVIRTESRGGEVVVRIEDNGVGIKPEDMDHIFEPFFSTKSEANGTGLGLSVSYGIVENHGGRFEVESTLGKGTVFSVFLPVGNSSAGQAIC